MSANGSRPGELSASGVTWVNNGYLGKTLSFDGTGRVESAEDAAFFDTDFAFEAFIICDNFAAQTRNAILSMNLDPTFLRVSSTGYLVVELPFDGGTGKVGFTGATALQTGRLYHVALSVSVTDQTMLLYLDGVQDGVLTSTEMMTLQDRTLYVGYDFNYASSHFKGIIDEVRFYDRPLTAAEVLAHSRQVYLTGEQGVVGATGGAGRTGPRGDTGAVGPVGDTGPQGKTGSVGPRGDTGERGVVGPQGPTGLIGDTLAHHIQLVTGGWLQAGDSTAGLFFGQTGSTFALIGRGGGRTHFAVRASDGAATFGYNRLDADGFETQVGDSYADEQSIRFVDTSRAKLSRLSAYHNSAWNGARLQTYERTGLHSTLDLFSEAPVGYQAIVSLTASNGDYEISMDVRVGATGGSIDLKADKARVQGGLYVGTLVGQTGSVNLGDIWATGEVNAAGSMSRLGLTGVVFVAATGTNAARGVNWRTVSGTGIGSLGTRYDSANVHTYWGLPGLTGRDSELFLESNAPNDRLSFVTLKATANSEGSIGIVAGPTGARASINATEVEMVGGVLIADEGGYELPDPGYLKVLYDLDVLVDIRAQGKVSASAGMVALQDRWDAGVCGDGH